MAKIVEDNIVVSISRIAKEDDSLSSVVNEEIVATLEQVVQQLVDLVIDPLNGLYPGSNAWNEDGYIQYNANAPASKSEAYTFQGNFSFIRAFLDRRHVGDGETYDASYGSIDRVILSS